MKFKVGDRIRFTPFCEGWKGKGTIVSIDPDDCWLPYRVLADGATMSCFFAEDEFELIEDEDENGTA
jgi:hypothetical protein